MGWLLPFSGFYDEVEQHIKKMTTRYHYETWRTRRHYALNGGCATLDFWKKSPRFGGTLWKKDVPWADFRGRAGRDFTEQDAIDDGFTSVEEYHAELGRMHRMSHEQVLDHVWAQIIWNPEHL